MQPTNVSKTLLRRLPIYLNYLKSLPETVTHISATTLAKALGFGDVQVRKDLAKVSHGGRRRTGHRLDQLIWDIESFLDLSSATNTVVVGAGKLGQALLDYGGFAESGLYVLAGFDISPTSPKTSGGKPLYAMDQLESFCEEHDVRIGIITVPADHAQSVCDRLLQCGVRAIWNFAPVHLHVPGDIPVHSENLAVSLTALRMQLKTQPKE